MGNFDTGQAKQVRFDNPFRFLDDEVVSVWLIAGTPRYQRGFPNVIRTIVKPLSVDVRTKGRERQFLFEFAHRPVDPDGDCQDCDARYTFHFYRSHGIPGIIYPP